MFKVKPLQLVKKVHFPIIEPVPTKQAKKEDKLFKRFLRFITNRRSFKIAKDYVCWSEYLQAFIFLPKSFDFDGASVPKLMNNIYLPTGILFYGACPHDFGYRYGGFILINPDTYECYFKQLSKKEIDSVFNDLCYQESGMKKASGLATFVLSFAGKIAWRKWRKESRSSFLDFPRVYE